MTDQTQDSLVDLLTMLEVQMRYGHLEHRTCTAEAPMPLGTRTVSSGVTVTR